MDHIAPPLQEPHATGSVAVTPVPVISLLVPDVDEEIERLAKPASTSCRCREDEIEGSYRTAQIRDNGRHRIELREPIDESGGFNPTGR